MISNFPKHLSTLADSKYKEMSGTDLVLACENILVNGIHITDDRLHTWKNLLSLKVNVRSDTSAGLVEIQLQSLPLLKRPG